jgi:predicted nucleic acid-binding protein
MKSVFADTLYWVAIVNPHDPWKEPAKKAKDRLGTIRLVTTDEVLTEFLATLGKSGAGLRKAAAEMVRKIMSNPNVTVLPQTREGFLRGLSKYENRRDKKYSLTDCVSMNAMESEGITEILTNDGHFEQEGFSILIKR